MNLQQLINYRSKCLICHQEMALKSLDLAGVKLILTEEGLKVETGNVAMSAHFKFDGTYQKLKRWNKLYARPLCVLRECDICPASAVSFEDNSKKSKLLKRQAGTTLLQIEDLRCAYSFDIFGDDSGVFDAHLNWEDIKYHDGKNFYHINTNFITGQTELISGNFQESLDSLLRLMLPAIDISSVKNPKELINKLKIYTLFS